MGMSSQPSAARVVLFGDVKALLAEVAQLCSPRGEAGVGRVTSEVECVDAGWVAGVGGVDLGVDGAIGVDGGGVLELVVEVVEPLLSVGGGPGLLVAVGVGRVDEDGVLVPGALSGLMRRCLPRGLRGEDGPALRVGWRWLLRTVGVEACRSSCVRRQGGVHHDRDGQCADWRSSVSGKQRMPTTCSPTALTVTVADVLAQTDYPGLSNSELVRLLRAAKLTELEDGPNKRERLAATLNNLQVEKGNGDYLVLFVNAAMNPVRYVGNPDRFHELQAQLNSVLVLHRRGRGCGSWPAGGGGAAGTAAGGGACVGRASRHVGVGLGGGSRQRVRR